MPFRNSVAISAVLGCYLYGGPSSAHHPTAANYDTSNVVTLRGVAAKIVFGAPHTYLWLDVQDAGSQATHWVVELDATAKVGAAGFTRRAAKAGRLVHGIELQLPDGHAIVGGDQ